MWVLVQKRYRNGIKLPEDQLRMDLDRMRGYLSFGLVGSRREPKLQSKMACVDERLPSDPKPKRRLGQLYKISFDEVNDYRIVISGLERRFTDGGTQWLAQTWECEIRATAGS